MWNLEHTGELLAMRVGIIGAQSRHVEYFGELINKSSLFGGARVEYIWGGDAPERLKECAAAVGIENIAGTPSEVVDSCDAVLITLRDGDAHAAYAVECLEKHKPVFVDKPFTRSVKDAVTILNTAVRTGTPFTGGSTLCFLPCIPDLKRKSPASPFIRVSYRADPFSPYGGWYFYGSHLTDLCAAICGTDAYSVCARLSGSEVTADVSYPGKKVRIFSAPHVERAAVTMDAEYVLDDKECYFHGMKAFFDVVSGGRSPDGERLLFSVRLMDAIMRSLASGRDVSV